MPGRRIIPRDCVELLLRFVKASGIEVSGRDLISAIGSDNRILFSSRGFGNMSPISAIREDRVLRGKPVAHGCTVGAEALDSFIQRRLGIFKSILLTVQVAVVL